ncbi:hypothetical protein BASA83_009099 [Batrachochytrium salamandrivorans]|nr:hypothetical protein BASA83_009099 [Batrachochytrium salamandrivorans]
MTESAVAAFLYDLMMTYGAPFEIISDRGKSFLAEGIDLFERENKIRHLATTPYHPQTNGMISLAPLDDIERMEESSEFIARHLEEVGPSTVCRQRFEPKHSRSNADVVASTKILRLLFQVGDMVKMKHHDRLNLSLNEGPYHVVDVGHPGLTG